MWVAGHSVANGQPHVEQLVGCTTVSEQPQMTRDFPPSDLFADRTLANQFRDDLLQLIGHTGEHHTNVTAAAQNAAEDHDPDQSSTWVRRVARMLGPSLTDLALPSILRHAALPTAAPAAPVVPPSEHQQWRLRARRLGHAASQPPLPPIELRITVARLYLDLLAAGVWQTDQSWRGELNDLVQVLPPTDEEYQNLPGPAVDFANSLTAVCVALLLQDASLSGTDEHDRIARTAWQQTRNWIAFADPNLVADYLYQPNAEHARVAGEAEITSLIEFTTDAEDDPDALLRMAFQNAEIPATRLDGAWVVDGDFRNPRRFAARTATIAGSPCVVLARNQTRSTTIVFDDHTVAIAESAVRRWRVYPLGPASTPLSLLGGDDGLPTTRDQYPLLPVPEQIRQMATHAGVNTVLLAAALK